MRAALRLDRGNDGFSCLGRVAGLGAVDRVIFMTEWNSAGRHFTLLFLINRALPSGGEVVL